MDRRHLPTSNNMFQSERGADINIHNGTFIQHNPPPLAAVAAHNCYDAKDGFNHLQAHVATAAFDSALKVDAPKCHPNTRQAVQDDIMNWVIPKEAVIRIQWILWLNGAAGAGKSAIARSIVALCLARNIPIARFFFFRTDATRNSIQPVVATLLHQLIHQLPDLLAIVVPKIQSDPLIFTKSLETQLQCLIFEPLRQLHREGTLTSVVLLFDGVDECDGDENQTDLVLLIADFLKSRDLPIIAFFGSRAEIQLQQVFRSHDVSASLLRLALDDHYLPDADIRLFLNDRFRQIKETHPFSHHLKEDWPNTAHIEEIVDKSSGQFIYSSVVANFVSSPRRNPAQQLEIVRGIRAPGNLTPFAQLDALYRHILSHVEDIESTSLILACAVFSSYRLPTVFEADPIIDDIPFLLADLSSVLIYEEDQIRFLHASLPDFLLDKARSQGYFLDKRFWCTRLAVHCFGGISAGISMAWSPLIYDFLSYSEGTPELREHVLALDLDQLSKNNILPLHYLTALRKVDFGDDGELYRRHLNHHTRYILENPSKIQHDIMSELQNDHDISAILAQIESEKADKLAVFDGPHIARNDPEHWTEAAGPVSDASAVNVEPRRA
ncbi:hypothetical protein HYPSUDRAFT_203855 [Hypholoma sublateritium FD-334 SS-4]|uniref:NACHT domain-containing protein n=1 Tax=Hypholoma sublateritium (strain FD-334 SS-4) TaxID=945553 RepID=A0A0D2NNG2_HYPSF|nr:hypothetical protein HYPSUDRAFT_203855 [Hypholoma sublateritium FD-334 SS-4]